jgi:RNA polymerase sigma-70 factor (ECF subfamily)
MKEQSTNEIGLSIDALRSGDRAEFARLVDLYSGLIYRLGLRILGNEQDAEDVLQETFIKAYRALPGFEARSQVSTWLYRIATNEALMLLRRQKPMVDIVLENEDEEEDVAPLEIVDWCCLPEEELLSSESRLFMEMAVMKLSAALRLVFLLRDVEGLSVKETAEVLGISEAAVKVRLMRARLAMREELTRYFGPQAGQRKVQDA